MQHLFVINPKSFNTSTEWRTFLLSVENCFSTGKREEYKIYISRYPRDAIAAVHRYISNISREETVRVYAVGGDGILFDCLNGLFGFPNAELASVPYGNANDFLRSFGNTNVKRFRNIKVLSHSPTILTDVVRCGNSYSIVNAAIGLEACAVGQVYKTSALMGNISLAKKYVPLMYKLGGIQSIFNKSKRLQYYNLNIDGKDYSGEYVNISVGNVFGNGGANSPNPYAIPNDGELNVIIIKSLSALKALKLFPCYTQGRFEENIENFIHITCKKIFCTSDRILNIILDGESFVSNKFDMEIIPNAIKIVAPENLHYKTFETARQDERKNKTSPGIKN
jgi:diacylglycerol kinase family enzyme